MLSRQRLDHVLNRRILPFVLGANLLMLLFFLAFNYQLMFHSDSAVKNLLAQEIWDTGEYFPHDWNYVNNDLWVFYTQTFILPLLRWFKNGFALHVVSDLVSATLILLASWWITGMLEQGRTARLVSMVLLTAGISLIFAEHVYGQAAYGSMYYMGCFLILSYWKMCHAQGRAALAWTAATMVLATLVFWANPQRALIYYGAPLLAAALALHGLDWYQARVAGAAGQARPWSWRWPLALALGMLLGSGLHAHIMRHVHNDAGVTLIHWLPFDGIVNNILQTTRGLLTIFDGLPRPETKVVSGYGVYSVLRLLAALATLALLPWSVLQSIQPRQRGRLYFAVFTLVSLLGNLLLVLTTTLANMNAPEGSGRYLVPTLLCMLLLLAGTICDGRHVRARTRAIAWFAIAVLGSSAPVAYIKSFDDFYRYPLSDTLAVAEHVRLAAFLEQNQLHYGYAPFWSAGTMTVLTQQRVKVRQVDFAYGLPVPMRALSSNRWYRPEAWNGPTFLMVQDTQFKVLDLEKLFALTGQPIRTLRFEKTWYIYEFADNLATRLPAWDNELHRPRKIAISAHSPHLVGKFVAGPEQPPALVAEDNEYGPQLYGPAGGVAPGSYLASFDVQAIGQPHDFGQVNVCVDAGTRVLAQQPITQAGRQTLTLRFATRTPLDPLELRVDKHPGGRLLVYGVQVVRAPDAGAPTPNDSKDGKN